uniref:Uncharacterized protein n=1 Tax=Siphoviridae sp. ctmpG14 TaxID=2825654 RepID=A0A8S5PAV0_9CAUD|nr:MAG TPA: hypothetical protein [Siphoviridae sp. ctmpG14]
MNLRYQSLPYFCLILLYLSPLFYLTPIDCLSIIRITSVRLSSACIRSLYVDCLSRR